MSSVTIPVAYVAGQILSAQQLNSVNSAVATAINDNDSRITTNAASIATINTNLGYFGKNAFFAQSSGSTTIANGATTTLEIDTEVHDADGRYAIDTFTFTPNQAGSYSLSASCHISSLAEGTAILYIYKNTTPYAIGKIDQGHGATGGAMGGSVVLTANGTSDAFTVKVARSTVNPADGIAATYASFSGFCVKPVTV